MARSHRPSFSVINGPEPPGAGPSRRISRGRVLHVIVGAILIIGAGVALLAGTDHKSGLGGSKPREGGDPPLRASRLKQIGKGLRSGTQVGMATAVALPQGAELSATTLRSFKRLRAVSMSLASFRDHRDGTASIHISVRTATGATQSWVGTLVVVQGRWKLAASSPA